MKTKTKIILGVVALAGIYGIAGNGKKSSSQPEPAKETTEYKTPGNFTDGYVYGDYGKYNVAQPSEDMGDDLIWLKGTFSKVASEDNDGVQLYYTELTTEEGDKWIVLLDMEGYGEKSYYEKICSHPVTVTGFYGGYMESYKEPWLGLLSLYDNQTGQAKESTAFTEYINNSSKPETTPEPEEPSSDAIRPEIKEAIDAYEAFIDEYVAFMEKYESSDNDTSLLMDYLNFMSKISDYEKKMDQLEKDLNDAEAVYFTEVMLRCDKKLLEAID